MEVVVVVDGCGGDCGSRVSCMQSFVTKVVVELGGDGSS